MLLKTLNLQSDVLNYKSTKFITADYSRKHVAKKKKTTLYTVES